MGLGLLGAGLGCSEGNAPNAGVASKGVEGERSSDRSDRSSSAEEDKETAASSDRSGVSETSASSDSSGTHDGTGSSAGSSGSNDQPGTGGTSTEGPSDGTNPPQPGACDADGWCRSTDDRFGDQVLQIGGTRDGSVVFATTETNEFLEYREGSWLYREGPFERGEVLLVVGDSDVWVGNSAGAWHWNGESWEQVTEGNVSALVATSNGVVWSLIDGVPNEWSATGWTAHPLEIEDEAPVDLAASDTSNELWLLTTALDGRRSKGRVYAFDQMAWVDLPGSMSEYGAEWRLTHFDDRLFVYADLVGLFDALNEWAPVAEAPTAAAVVGVPGEGLVTCSPTPAFLQFEGTSEPTALELSTFACSTLWARSPEDIWTANVLGGVTHLTTSDVAVDEPLPPMGDAASFTRMPTSVWVGPGTMDAWGTSPSDVWASGTHHWDGEAWSQRTTEGASHTFGTSTEDVWLVNDNYTAPRHWDGASLSTMTVALEPTTGAIAFRDGLASAKNEAWFAVTEYRDSKMFGGVLHAKAGVFDEAFAFQTELPSTSGLMAGAFLAGDVENGLWLGLPNELWRRVDGSWELALVAPEGESFIDGEVFEGHLWVLLRQTIAELDGSSLQPRGKRRGATRLSVSEDGSLWAHSAFSAARWTP